MAAKSKTGKAKSAAKKKSVEHFNVTLPVAVAKKARADAVRYSKELGLPKTNTSAYFSAAIAAFRKSE